jgi:tRNA nucleotidyltransferase (CCA-adding enzyme)
MQFFLVGGAVRDELLNLPPKERDWVVVGATASQMEALGFKRVGKDFPVFLHPETHEEYALARTERKTGPGYHGFQVHAASDVTLEQDLLRRDLTINAIARTAEGHLIDPYHGQHDLQQRWLRHVSPAFAEDPVRILRIARFAARYHHLGFRVAPETLTLMQSMVNAGEADALVAERVWQETVRALGEPHPQQFIQVLRDCGALPRLFPELDRLFGVPQPVAHHPEIDTGLHILLCLQQSVGLNADTVVRFAVLVHDLGKGITPVQEWPRHHRHEQYGATLVSELCQRVRAPREYRELGELVAKYHIQCHNSLQLRPGTVLKLLHALDSFRRYQRFQQFLLACEIDARGRKGLEQRAYPQADWLRVAHTAAAAIDVRKLTGQGFQGKDLAEAIRSSRLQAISAAKTQWQSH